MSCVLEQTSEAVLGRAAAASMSSLSPGSGVSTNRPNRVIVVGLLVLAAVAGVSAGVYALAGTSPVCQGPDGAGDGGRRMVVKVSDFFVHQRTGVLKTSVFATSTAFVNVTDAVEVRKKTVEAVVIQKQEQGTISGKKLVAPAWIRDCDINGFYNRGNMQLLREFLRPNREHPNVVTYFCVPPAGSRAQVAMKDYDCFKGVADAIRNKRLAASRGDVDKVQDWMTLKDGTTAIIVLFVGHPSDLPPSATVQ